MGPRGWLSRQRKVEMASELTDPEWVIVELLCSLPKDKLRVFIRESLLAQRDLHPGEAAEEQRGGLLINLLHEAAQRRPELLVHFGRVTQLLVAWGDKNEELKARAARAPIGWTTTIPKAGRPSTSRIRLRRRPTAPRASSSRE